MCTELIELAPLIEWTGKNIEHLLTILVILFAAIQVKKATSAFRASTLSQVAATGAELQWRVIQDKELISLLYPGSDPRVGKRSIAAGIVINHFATAFDLHRLGGVPKDIWATLKEDMRVTLSQPQFSRKWKEVQKYHDIRFRAFVNCHLLELCKPDETKESDSKKEAEKNAP